MRIRFLACALAALSLLAVAAPKSDENASTVYSQGDGPQFRCQLGQRLGPETDSLRLVAAMSLPYDNLVFLRADSGFTASFDLVTTVMSDSGSLIGEKISTVSAFARNFAETNSRSRNAVHVDELLVPPGTYKVRVSLTADKEGRRKSRWEGKLTLAPSDPLLRVSDIYWIAEDTALADAGIPRVVESYSTEDTVASVRVQLISSGKDSVRIKWSLLGQKKDSLHAEETSLLPTGKVEVIDYTVHLKGLPAQNYTLKFEAVGNGRREARSRNFSIHFPGIPVSITNIEMAIRQLKYIAVSADYNRLRNAAPADREKLFKQFWDDQAKASNADPTELMEEYYRRVEYSNEKFSTNRPGWENDRGRIYIRYGEPTDVERHPFESGSRPYEIWFYSQLSLRFVFVDYTGFGDYNLAGPDWGY
jgi:GWxTD domain-containing protein